MCLNSRILFTHGHVDSQPLFAYHLNNTRPSAGNYEFHSKKREKQIISWAWGKPTKTKPRKTDKPRNSVLNCRLFDQCAPNCYLFWEYFWRTYTNTEKSFIFKCCLRSKDWWECDGTQQPRTMKLWNRVFQVEWDAAKGSEISRCNECCDRILCDRTDMHTPLSAFWRQPVLVGDGKKRNTKQTMEMKRLARLFAAQCVRGIFWQKLCIFRWCNVDYQNFGIGCKAIANKTGDYFGETIGY